MRNVKKRVVTGLLVVGFISFGLTYLVKPGTSHAASICSVSDKLVNSCRPWLGSFVNGYGGVAGDEQSQIAAQEQRQGRQNDVVHTYHSLGNNTLNSTDTYFANRPNTILFTNWKPVSKWASIASANSAIDSMANSIKALGSTKIMLTLWHEPENDVSPGGDPNCPNVQYKGSAGTVADYRNMWAYTENRFAADGVTNVVWVMNYMSFSNWDCLVPDLYPGDNLVDWVVFDPYGPNTHSGVSDFVGTVSRFTNLLTADTDSTHSFTSKPWGFGEWGVGGATLDQENLWYDQAKQALDDNIFPAIKLYTIFDAPTGNWNGRVGYDDNGTVDPAKGAHYYSFANDAALTGDWSFRSTVAPGPPSDLTATAIAGSQVSLSWSPGTVTQAAIAGYNVYRSDSSTPIATVTTGTSYVDTPPSDGITYNYTVSTLDVTGNASPPSAQASVALSDTIAPGATTNLTATIGSSSEIDLTWTPAADNVSVTGYNIYRNGTLLTSVGAVSSYQDQTADTQTTNSYSIEAYDAAHNVGPVSQPVTAILPDTTPPTTPGNVTPAITGLYQISLSWQPSTDNDKVIGYNVYRDGTQIATVIDGSNGFVDTGLTDASTYNYSVSAFDPAGNISTPSPAAQILLPDETAPTPPANLTAAANGSTVTLAWQPSTDNVGVAEYNIYRNGVLINTIAGTTTSFTDSGLQLGTTYQYAVAAFDAQANLSAKSSFVNVTPTDNVAPSTPTNLKVSSSTIKSVSLSWTASSDNVGITGYTIYRNGVQLTKVGKVTTFTDSSTLPSTAYTYKILAFDAAGNASAQSAGASTTTPADTTAPTAPTSPTLTLNSSSITVKWTASTDNNRVANYVIYRNSAKLATVTGTSYTDTSVKQGTTYSYFVVAVDPSGNISSHSTTQTMKFPDTTPPTAPATTATTGTTSKTIIVKWTASTDNVGVTGYRVYRGTTLIATVSSTTLSYTVGSLSSGASYSFHTVAFDAAGNTSASSAIVTAKAR